MDKSNNFSALIILCLKEELIPWGPSIYIIVIYGVKILLMQRNIKVFVFVKFQNNFEVHIETKGKGKYSF